MVSKVQVEQKEQVQSSQGATQDEPRSVTNRTGDQHSHLRERDKAKWLYNTNMSLFTNSSPLIYHSKCREPSNNQPEKVEERVEVDVIGDEKDHTVAKKTITLKT